MPTAVVILANGFEEIEAVTIIDTLRRAEVAVTIAGLAAGAARGSHDIFLGTDCALEDISATHFDAVVLPGGLPGATNLRDSPAVRDLVSQAAQSGKLVAAICAGPIALEAAGVLQGKKATSYPGHELPSAAYHEERVVTDGNIVTSRGPGTALDFSLALVARLVSEDKAMELRQKMLVSSGS